LGRDTKPLSYRGWVFSFQEVQFSCLSLGNLLDIGAILAELFALALGFLQINNLKFRHYSPPAYSGE
jgi:hypothetical protein